MALLSSKNIGGEKEKLKILARSLQFVHRELGASVGTFKFDTLKVNLSLY